MKETPVPQTRSIVLLSTDLMMTSKVSGIAGQHGIALVTTTDTNQLQDCTDQDLILIDLATAGLDIAVVGQALSSHQLQSAIVYGPHVHVDRFEQAKSVGFKRVLARGAFNTNVAQLVGQFAGSDT